MSRLRVAAFAISLDRHSAGPGQDRDNPLRKGAAGSHRWFDSTRTFRRMHGGSVGATGVDDDFAARGGGEPRFGGIDLPELGEEVREPLPAPAAAEFVLAWRRRLGTGK